MKIILKKDVQNLGEAGEVVEVKSGYALNYLVPQGFASVATKGALKQYEETIRQRAHKEAKIVAEAETVKQQIESLLVKLTVKVSESGKLYGAVTAAMVADALAALGINVDKKNISVPEIKEAGEFEGTAKVYKAVVADVKILVEAEKAEGKKADAKAETAADEKAEVAAETETVETEA
jgi:large subunit ribosomal protein L9